MREYIVFLRFSGRRARVKTTLIVFGISCISTVAITFSNYSSITHSQGVSTTLWVTGVIILSNVIIFILVPTMAYAAPTRARARILPSEHFP